ncbi:30S ribosome-binding factor RbfA [Acidipila sp. EB88]|uniref:30S ribosome-binding factor RbfA n=1 Tax=Acidipila sp. EB88 TaxID=2305226 RepID=UPI000F5E88D0|nr:30S ribosome-binding factor RbfA [Acidipila sp. EB88]RRA47751.1 30S ribosome-binding factor RbfA [Acidipila sp. EB88]
MPEQRARKYHQDRIAETIREEIDAMILGDLSDPRISSAHVTQVLLNPGGKSAEIYLQVDGGPAAEVATIEGLMAARGWIRAELKYRMGKRQVPDVAFHADRSERMVGRIDELLTRTRKRNKYPQAEPAAAQPEESLAPAKTVQE